MDNNKDHLLNQFAFQKALECLDLKKHTFVAFKDIDKHYSYLSPKMVNNIKYFHQRLFNPSLGDAQDKNEGVEL